MKLDPVSFTALPPGETHFASAASLRVRSDWFNRLRWIAVAALFVMSTLSETVGGIPLPLRSVYGICALLLILNTGYVLRNRRLDPVDLNAEIRMVQLQMVADLILLTLLLNLTGGIENPFQYVYVIHVVIAGMLFKGRGVYGIAILATTLFTGDVVLELLDILPHQHMPHCTDVAHSGGYTVVALTAFCLIVLFSAYMTASIMKHNRAIKDDLVERQERLAASGKAKLDFFRFVTHEIKSPVITAQSAVETAIANGGAQMNPDVRDMLERAIKRLRQATDIIKDLAEFTQGGVLRETQCKDVDLGAVVQRVMESQSDLIAKRDLKPEIGLPAEPLVFDTDPDMFESIVMNLIGNAVRYNRDGGKLRVDLKRDGDRVVLEVEDGGIGILPEEREQVFQEFYRSPAARKVSSLGTGLGLPIVKKFVERLGGDIALESRPGVGTTFRITIWKT